MKNVGCPLIKKFLPMQLQSIPSSDLFQLIHFEMGGPPFVWAHADKQKKCCKKYKDGKKKCKDCPKKKKNRKKANPMNRDQAFFYMT